MVKKILLTFCVLLGFSLFPFKKSFSSFFLPVSERDVYEESDKSELSNFTIIGIKPYSCEKMIALLGKEEKEASSWCKRGLFSFYSFDLDSYFLTEEDAFSLILDHEGERLKEGFNGFLTLSFGGFPTSWFSYMGQFRLSDSYEGKKAYLHRGIISLDLEAMSLIGGRDNVKVGPSKYGNLLSGLNIPFWQIRLQNNRPFKFLGLWEFLALHGWLLEKRKDHSDPRLLFLRADWKPFDWLEFGINRATLYGGKGRPSYRSLSDYLYMLSGREENISGSKWDNDGFLGFDLTLNIPLKGFQVFRIYLEKNATDVKSGLQKGEKYQFDLPFIVVKLYEGAKTIGVLIQKNKLGFRGEITLTKHTMYLHHAYFHEGFSYKGIILGYPYGTDMLHTMVEIQYTKNEKQKFGIELGFFEQPFRQKLNFVEKMNRYYCVLKGAFDLEKLKLMPFIRIDYTEGDNYSFLPNHFELKTGNKIILDFGMRLSYKFF
jgi:hypothetical protein